MIENNAEKDLGSEERLKTISYQFVSLYERWSEDRKKAERLNAEFEDFLERFKNQVDHFELLAPSVRRQIGNDIESVIQGSAQTVSEAMKKEAAHTTEQITAPLRDVTKKTLQTLESYEKETALQPLLIFGIPIVSSIIISLIIVFFLMPTPKLALTDQQISYAAKGIAMEEAWPKLSQEEQHHWRALNLEIRKNWSKDKEE